MTSPFTVVFFVSASFFFVFDNENTPPPPRRRRRHSFIVCVAKPVLDWRNHQWPHAHTHTREARIFCCALFFCWRFCFSLSLSLSLSLVLSFFSANREISSTNGRATLLPRGGGPRKKRKQKKNSRNRNRNRNRCKWRSSRGQRVKEKDKRKEMTATTKKKATSVRSAPFFRWPVACDKTRVEQSSARQKKN